MTFNIGDRVIATKPVAGSQGLYGKVGTVVCLNVDSFDLGVDFDDYFTGHSCHGKGKQGHCRYGSSSEFTLETEQLIIELLAAITNSIYKCRYDNKDYFIKLQKKRTTKILNIKGYIDYRGIIIEV